MTDGGPLELQETMGMGVDLMKRLPMETKMKTGIGDVKSENEAKMWDVIYRNRKTRGMAKGLRSEQDTNPKLRD